MPYPFNLSELLNKTLNEAKALILSRGFKYQIVVRDGVPIPVAPGFNHARISLEVEKDVVTRATIG